MKTPGHGRGTFFAWIVALLFGLALRAAPITAARPYIHYVDEGHVLRPVYSMIRDRTWDPREFVYPQFPRLVIAAASRFTDGAVRLAGGPSLRDRMPARFDGYDQLEPFAFLLIARGLSVVVGMGIVVVTGLFARRLFGPVAGVAAALLAAFVPALALRGPIASVDSWATLACLACLYATDETRTSRRPAVAAFAAGYFAGVAFASKYPALLVSVALAMTTLLLPISTREKIRRLFAGGRGAIVGILTAMPALWRHWVEMPQVFRSHWEGYAHSIFERSLWHQALVRAESDLYYSGPELGIVFCLFAFTGLAIAVRRSSLVATVTGWCAFAAVMCLLFARGEFRPFRNLMPLVPVACVTAGISFAQLREWSRRPRLVDALGCLTLLVVFGAPMAAHAKRRFDLVDPRRAAVDWLAANARGGDSTLYLKELAILEGEVARVPGRTIRVSADEAAARIRAELPRFVVAGVLMHPDRSLDAAAAWPELANYRPVLTAGDRPTVPFQFWWHGNDEIVIVFERRTPA